MTSVVISCHCTNDFQDKRYGKQRRLANYTAKGEGRCTVCGSVHMDVPKITIQKKKASGGKGGAKTMTVSPPPGGWPGGAPEQNGYRRIGGK
jgi:hypothetical protein